MINFCALHLKIKLIIYMFPCSNVHKLKRFAGHVHMYVGILVHTEQSCCGNDGDRGSNQSKMTGNCV